MACRKDRARILTHGTLLLQLSHSSVRILFTVSKEMPSLQVEESWPRKAMNVGIERASSGAKHARMARDVIFVLFDWSGFLDTELQSSLESF